MAMLMDDPAQYVSKIASKAGLSQQTQNTAIQLLKEAKKRQALVGKGPIGMAAATLYIAATLKGEAVTQREVAELAGVTEVTIRNRYQDLDRLLNLGLSKKRRRG